MRTVLIAYFSHRGENYVEGRIEDLKIGNTEYIAKQIQGLCAGDIIEIARTQPYPKVYKDTVDIAMKEYKDNTRPIVKKLLPTLYGYDTIILGYPNWCGTMPMSVWTFLENYDFSDKCILPLCTHEGSGMGCSVADIKKLCPTAHVASPLAIKGSCVKEAAHEVQTWLIQEGILS